MAPLDDFEYYETPQAFIHYLFREVPITGSCFEPCVGSGAVPRASRDVIEQGMDAAITARLNRSARWWLTNDMDERWTADWHHDASQEHLWETVDDVGGIDWTVSNTPFTPALDIAEHALKHSRVGVALFLRASIHEVLKTGPRRTWMRDHPPNDILWLPRFAFQRSKKTSLWTTDSVCCCWCVWRQHDRAQSIKYAPTGVLDALDAETVAYRGRMDEIMGRRAPTMLT